MTARLDVLGRTIGEDVEDVEDDEANLATVEMGAISEVEILGDYVLVKHLARGAMCEVWLALQMFLGELIRPVIIKRVDPQLARDPEFKKRFLREAAILDRVRSPAIAPIYEVGTDGESFFIATTFVQGESVQEIIAATARAKLRIPEPIAARIAADALGGLHAIHMLANAKGKNLSAAHHDLSAQSVVVGYDGRVQLSDTGIGKAAEGFSREMRWFSPYKARYKSPEQARGKRGCSRSDQYSIGVLLFEMITGSVSPVAASEEERRDILDALAPKLDRGLRAIILSALSIDPLHRFRSAADMKNVLEGAIRQMMRDPLANDRVERFMQLRFKNKLTETRIMLRNAADKAAAAIQLSVRRAEKEVLDMIEIGTVLEESAPVWIYP